MKNENKVLACVDQSHFADRDYAAWAARRMDAPLEFLHVIDRHPEQASGEDHSGAIGIDAQKLCPSSPLKTRSHRECTGARSPLPEPPAGAGHCCRGRTVVCGNASELEETLAEQEEGVRLWILGPMAKLLKRQRDLGAMLSV
jgi:hypothetical protein